LERNACLWKGALTARITKSRFRHVKRPPPREGIMSPGFCRRVRFWRHNSPSCELRWESVLDRVVAIALTRERVGARLCRQVAIGRQQGRRCRAERASTAPNNCIARGRGAKRTPEGPHWRVSELPKTGVSLVTICMYIVRISRAKFARKNSKEFGNRQHSARENLLR